MKDYPLWNIARSYAERPRIVPPVPKPGQRKPRPYSCACLDSLYATIAALRPVCMVSFQAPPSHRIVTEKELARVLKGAKQMLTNMRRRAGLPPCTFATEFDPFILEGTELYGANFHLLFGRQLDSQHRDLLCAWFLREMGLNNNQGRAFQYDAKGGGEKLRKYGSKDRKPQGYVKFRPPWLPERLSYSLWFCVGLRRVAARKGFELRKNEGWRRRMPDSEHGHLSSASLTVSTGRDDSEHGGRSITGEVEQVLLCRLPPVSSLFSIDIAKIDPRFHGASPRGMESFGWDLTLRRSSLSFCGLR